MEIQKFRDRFGSLTDETSLDTYMMYSRDIGWALSKVDFQYLGELSLILANARDAIVEPVRRNLLQSILDLVCTFRAGIGQKEDKNLALQYAKGELPKSILAFMHEKGIVTLDGVRAAVASTPEAVDDAVVKLVHCGYIEALGNNRFFASWRGEEISKNGKE